MIEKKFVEFKFWEKYERIDLVVTNYKLCIRPGEVGQTIHFPLGKIEKLHKYTNNENSFKMLIVLKDGRKFKFKVLSEKSWKVIYDKI